jgi:hypothetical protein
MDPQVIADTALYLNSDLAAKVTGVTIPVDAGHLILPPSNPSPARLSQLAHLAWHDLPAAVAAPAAGWAGGSP